MNGAFFTANPASRYQAWHTAHKPSVGVFVRRTSLACNLPLDVVFETEAAARTLVDDGLHHVKHLIGCLLTDHFAHTRRKLRNDVSLVVFDLGDENRGATDAFIDKGGVSAGHFANRDFAGTQAKRQRRINLVVGHSKFMQIVNEARAVGVNLIHEFSRNPVV